MDRMIYYSGQVPLSAQFLQAEKNKMLADAMLAQAVFGTGTVVSGLTVTPTSPASLSVLVGQGSILAMAAVDATAYGSLSADTTNQVLKQGIQIGNSTLTLTPPTTSGYSINYLIEAAFAEVDTTTTVLPYYNAANPSVSLLGPGGSGTSQATIRQGTVSLVAKAGVAAATGSQVTPAPDAGYVGLYVVTVAYGATSITSGNISAYAGAPIVNLQGQIQTLASSYGVDTGTANNYVVALTPALTAYVDGMKVRFKAGHANTGASTLNAGPSALPILSTGGTTLGSGVIVAGQDYEVIYSSAASSWLLLAQTGGQFVVPTATISGAAVNLAQLNAAIPAAFTSGGSTTLTLPASGGAQGTVGSSGWRKFPDGTIEQWAAILLRDDGTNIATTWTFPIAFTVGAVEIKAQLADLAAGGASYNSIASVKVAPSLTSVGFSVRNSVATGNYCFIVTAKGK